LGTEGNLDDAVLLWDRRPFEPLYIKDDETWPPARACSIIYFEPDIHSPTVQALHGENGEPRLESIDVYHIIISAIGSRAGESLAELFEKMFPDRATADIIKAIPSLFAYMPKQLSSDDAVWSTASTSTTIYDKFKYDPSVVRLRSLPIAVIMDLVKEYMSYPGRPESTLQVNRNLGGSITPYNSGSMHFIFSAGKAAGKVKDL
jgi:transcription factor 1